MLLPATDPPPPPNTAFAAAGATPEVPPIPPKRGRKPKPDVTESDLAGFKYFDQLMPLLAKLHDSGTKRDRAGNRTLHMDQYVALILLYLFNPTLTSLRGIQQASNLKKVQRKLGCARASLGSLSESARVFDPELLKDVIAELGEKMQPIHADQRLGDIRSTLTLVDGSLLQGLPKLIEAMYGEAALKSSRGKWCLHAQFHLDKHVPTSTEVRLNTGGKNHERDVLAEKLEASRTYVMDRGYAVFWLFNAIVEAGSSYVCRIRDNSVYDVKQERKLSDEAVAAGVLADLELEHLGSPSGRSRKHRPKHPVRLIQIKTTANPTRRRGGSKTQTDTSPTSDGVLRIATNLTDVPAETIALIYRYRWTIEIFFRFFKHVLGCRHLLSASPKGIQIQTYTAVIACMLVTLWSGRKPTLRTYEMVCFYFSGMASLEELTDHIAGLKRHNDAEMNV